jgi:hypothetical protein
VCNRPEAPAEASADAGASACCGSGSSHGELVQIDTAA